MICPTFVNRYLCKLNIFLNLSMSRISKFSGVNFSSILHHPLSHCRLLVHIFLHTNSTMQLPFAFSFISFVCWILCSKTSLAQLVITPIQTPPTQTTANVIPAILPTESWPTFPLGVRQAQATYLTDCNWCNSV